MPLVSDRCICLRKFEHSETSQIVTLFSREHGIVRVMAKGSHRRTKAGASRFDGGVDLLDVGQAVFSDDSSRELALFTEWKMREGHLELRKNLRAMYLGLYAIELVYMLIEEHDPHPQIFDGLESLLPDLATPRIEQAFLAFQLDLLREAGYSPQLASCVSCANPLLGGQTIYFSPRQGGLICRNCEMVHHDRRSLDVRLLRLIQGMLQMTQNGKGPRRLPHLTRYQTDPLNQMFADHIENTLNRRLRMAQYVLSPMRLDTAGQKSDKLGATQSVLRHNSSR